MAEIVKGTRATGVQMSLAEIIYAYNTLKGEPIPAGLTYEAAADALQKEFGADRLCTTANTMDREKYVHGQYDFQVTNRAKGIHQ